MNRSRVSNAYARLTESIVEDTAIERFGNSRFRGSDLDDANQRAGASTVVHAVRNKAAIRRLNPQLSEANIDPFVASLSRPPQPTLIENNHHFHILLTDGVPVEYKNAKTGETRGGRVRAFSDASFGAASGKALVYAERID